MPIMKHPNSGAVYTLRKDGQVDVENNGVKGVFTSGGRYVEGDIKQADPHFILWLAGPQLPAEAQIRINR